MSTENSAIAREIESYPIVCEDGTIGEEILLEIDGEQQWVTTFNVVEGKKAAPLTKPSKRRIMSSAAFVQDWRPPNPLIQGVYQRGFLYAITGNSGTGKTAICLRLAAHVALGWPVGTRNVRQGRVLYFAGENPDDIRTRWLALCETLNTDPGTLPVDFVAGVFPIEELVEEARSAGERYDLVIVDTSAAYFEGEDENSNPEFKVYAQALRRITRLPGNPCVLVACHTAKGGGKVPRGASSFLAEIDGNTYLDKCGNSVRLCQHEKFRGPEFDPVPFDLRPLKSGKLRDQDGEPIQSIMAVPRPVGPKPDATTKALPDEILDALCRTGYRSLSRLAAEARLEDPKGKGKSNARRRLKKLERSGLVMRTREGTWRVTPAGERSFNSQTKSNTAGETL